MGAQKTTTKIKRTGIKCSLIEWSSLNSSEVYFGVRCPHVFTKYINIHQWKNNSKWNYWIKFTDVIAKSVWNFITTHFSFDMKAKRNIRTRHTNYISVSHCEWWIQFQYSDFLDFCLQIKPHWLWINAQINLQHQR